MTDTFNPYEARYKALVQSHYDLISRYDVNYIISYVSPSYCHYFGRPASDLIGTSIMDVIAGEELQREAQVRLASISLDSPVTNSVSMVRVSNNQTKAVNWVTSGIFDDEGKLIEFQSVGRDISELQQAQNDLVKSQMHYKQAARIAGVGYWIWDEIKDQLIYCTEEASTIYGTTVDESLHRSSTLSGNLSSTHPDDLLKYENTVKAAFENKTGYDITVRTIRPDGETRYIRQLAEPILDEQGNLVQTIGTVQDVTDQKLVNDRIAYMAHHDILTELPNRALFFDRFDTALKTAKREKRQLAILFIDLDGFKSVNDSSGHHIGDLLLVDVAHRLNDCVRETDTIGRMGGDEFAIILGGDVTQQNVSLIAKKILTTLSNPFHIKETTHQIGASIGIAIYPDHGEQAEGLLAKADEAMYKVKGAGKNNFSFAQLE